ncbi:hypothetical protein AG4045_014382 [Apium graveolens]|uniref:Uncharacterized protein n=1 Tax=Apium graveolens TaxID=4045 RepID=A0A6L5B7Y1_APIGR|nr:hypothetical protein AG4045_014382 [Apium graveolens]
MVMRSRFQTILVMPENYSIERKIILLALGVELYLTDKSNGVAGISKKAKEILERTPMVTFFSKFMNPANSKVYGIEPVENSILNGGAILNGGNQALYIQKLCHKLLRRP